MKFSAATRIDAAPQRVWDVLTDISAWHEWDSYTEKIEGDLVLGGKVKAFSTLNPGKAFPVKVAAMDSPSRMQWTGGMPFGLFKGVRTFQLSPQGSGTEFSLTEEFSGPLLGLIGRTIPDMSDAFASFVAGLKARAES
jgi:hypothetical protein